MVGVIGVVGVVGVVGVFGVVGVVGVVGEVGVGLGGRAPPFRRRPGLPYTPLQIIFRISPPSSFSAIIDQ